MTGPRPNRTRGLERAENSLRKIAETFEQLQTRNNHTTKEATISLLTALILLRLVNIRFVDLGFEGFTDNNSRARKYIVVLMALIRDSKPITVTYLCNAIGSNINTIKPIISNLLQSGYIRQLEFYQNEQLNGRSHAKKHTGYELTAKGHDQVKNIISKLIDQRIFPLS